MNLKTLRKLLLSAFSLITLQACGQSADPFGSLSSEGFTLGYYGEKKGFYVEDYKGDGQTVYIPKEATVNNITAPIVGIKGYAFAQRESIKELHLSENIHVIEDFAFVNSGIKKLYVTGFLVDIGESAFDNSSIEFYHKDNLVYLPGQYGDHGYIVGKTASINDFDVYLPDECEGTIDNVFQAKQKIHVSDKFVCFGSLTKGESSSYDHGYIAKEGKTIASEIAKAGDYARIKPLPTRIHMREGVSFVGKYAFSSGENQTKYVHIPSSVTSIPEGTLHPFSNIEELAVPFIHPSTDYYHACLDYHFYQPPTSYFSEYNENVPASLRKLTVYGGRERIGKLGLSKLESLEDVSLEEGIVSIDSTAFYGCSSLSSIHFSSSVKDISKDSFLECPSLSRSEHHGIAYLGVKDNPYYVCLGFAQETLSSFSLHPECKIIASSAFSWQREMNIPVFPEGLISIGSSAFVFASCDKQTLTFPSTLSYIGSYAFQYPQFRSAFIPITVRYIGACAFSSNTQTGQDSNLREIRCEAEKQPEAWDGKWNMDWYINGTNQDPSYITTTWGCNE